MHEWTVFFRLFLRVFFLAGVCFDIGAYAAQIAKVSVNGAKVFATPSDSGLEIHTFPQGAEIEMSNLTTKGFFKVRISDDRTGWIRSTEVEPVVFQHASVEKSTDRLPEENKQERRRLLVRGGIRSPVWGDFESRLQLSQANPITTLSAEAQFKWTPTWFWALRVDGDIGGLKTNGYEFSQFQLPISLGLVMNVLDYADFRMGLGAYLGYSVLSSQQFVVVSGTTRTTLDYGARGLVATFTLPLTLGLGKNFGIQLEANYRYQAGVSFPASPQVSSFPAMALDLSGLGVLLGIEMKFYPESR